MVQLTSIRDHMRKRKRYTGIRRDRWSQLGGFYKRQLLSPGAFARPKYGYGIRRNNLGVITHQNGGFFGPLKRNYAKNRVKRWKKNPRK